MIKAENLMSKKENEERKRDGALGKAKSRQSCIVSIEQIGEKSEGEGAERNFI